MSSLWDTPCIQAVGSFLKSGTTRVMNSTWWKKLLEEIKHLCNSQLEGRKLLNQVACSWTTGPQPHPNQCCISVRNGEMVFLSTSKVWVPIALSSAASFHNELGSPGRAQELPQSCAGMSVPKAASGLWAWGCQHSSSPACIQVSSLEIQEPWTTTDGDFAHRATSLSPSRLHSLFLSGGAFSLLSAVPYREWEVKGGLDEAAALQGGDVASRTGPRKEGSVPEKRGDERVIATHFNSLFKTLGSSRSLPEEPDTPTSPPWLSHILPALRNGILSVWLRASGCACLRWTSSPEHTPSIQQKYSSHSRLQSKGSVTWHLFVTSPGSVVPDCSFNSSFLNLSRKYFNTFSISVDEGALVFIFPPH